MAGRNFEQGQRLVPPIVVRDELEAGILIEHCRIPEVTERFYAIVQKRRFPNRLLGELLVAGKVAPPKPARHSLKESPDHG